MPSKKYEDLSATAKQHVVDQNRDINVKTNSWFEEIVDRHNASMVNKGFVNPNIDFSVSGKPYDGVLITFDDSYPKMINENLPSYPAICVDLNEDMQKYVVENAKINPVFRASSFRVGEYPNETSKELNIKCELVPESIPSKINSCFCEWETLSTAQNEYASLEKYGILTNLAQGRILYGVRKNEDNNFTEFKFANFNLQKLQEKIVEWELMFSDDFKTKCITLFPDFFMNGFEEFEQAFALLSFTDQLYIVANTISFEKLIGEENQSSYDFQDLIRSVDETYIKDFDKKLEDFLYALSENFKAWLDDRAKEIYKELKEAYDDATSDKAVIDTLTVNNFFGMEYDEDGNPYNDMTDTKFEYLELSPEAKHHVNDEFFKTYSFAEWNKERIAEIKEEAKKIGINFDITFSDSQKCCIIENLTFDYPEATEWMTEGIVIDGVDKIKTFTSENDVPEEYKTQVNININAMRETLTEKIRNWSYEKFQEDTDELAIADFYDGTFFDINGNEIPVDNNE